MFHELFLILVLASQLGSHVNFLMKVNHARGIPSRFAKVSQWWYCRIASPLNNDHSCNYEHLQYVACTGTGKSLKSGRVVQNYS